MTVISTPSGGRMVHTGYPPVRSYSQPDSRHFISKDVYEYNLERKKGKPNIKQNTDHRYGTFEQEGDPFQLIYRLGHTKEEEIYMLVIRTGAVISLYSNSTYRVI